MNLLQSASNYIDRITGSLPANGVHGTSTVGINKNKIKVLLLDKDTTSIVSMITTQSHLLSNAIYLIDTITNTTRTKMRHLSCVVFIRPTPDSIQALVEELRNPLYGSYELYFTNIIKKSSLERIAESDDHEAVTKVQEVFADYLCVNPDLFEVGLAKPNIFGSMPDSWTAEALNRSTETLTAVLLALKQKPLIRYDANSLLSKKLANEVSYRVRQDPSLYDFRRPDTPPVLLILDRKNDPITPLLLPWTYQAMVHELLGITNNRVNLSVIPDVRPELQEIVLSGTQGDNFFQKSMYLNFGDLGATIKEYVDQYQTKTKNNTNIESIDDMKRFVEDYPEFRKLAGNVSKHVTLVSELSRLVEAEGLLAVSELEQSLACNDSHNQDLKQIQIILQSPNISFDSKVRLVALYGLRYEKNANFSLPALLDLLDHQQPHPYGYNGVNAIKSLLSYAGAQKRDEGIFGGEGFFSRAQSGFKGLKGVENVYTQHTTLLSKTLSSLLRGKMKDASYPIFDDGVRPKLVETPAYGVDTNERPQNVIVFIVGGVTYEEARVVAEINAGTPGISIVLGSTKIINSYDFIKNLNDISHKGLIKGQPLTRLTFHTNNSSRAAEEIK
ncbi:Sec1-like protein [Nadsonia fulvescens var. elongata DSM 6958]|uniref:Sec1-like protein n=1 Tax=Nadsonia fulvescens var. elongata DSM 6958 TaxID=857566 RepID=A0A1E3PRX4_9ASCO|nr:Sec1-like protein [Nadsonia fulvescens var. elongata DSM 6958]